MSQCSTVGYAAPKTSPLLGIRPPPPGIKKDSSKKDHQGRMKNDKIQKKKKSKKQLYTQKKTPVPSFCISLCCNGELFQATAIFQVCQNNA